MNKSTKIALVVYTAVWLLVNKVRNVVRGLAIKYTGILFLSGDGDNSRVQLSLLLRNSLPFSVTINRIDGILYLQGSAAASINQELNLRIEGTSVTPVNLLVDIDWGGVSQGVYNNIMTGNIETLSLQFVGSVTAEGKTFNVTKTIGYYDLV